MNPVKIAHLSWVRGPIVKYIERCKQAMVSISGIRSRIENPPVGAEPIWFVNQKEKLTISHDEFTHLLSCISASLKMVDSDGGYTLANEARTLASTALTSMTGDAQDKALLAMQAALNVLPSYISMVIEGAQDTPGVLLKYINELRALREVPPLEDGSALPVNLSFGYKSPPLYEKDCDLSERERVFKKAASKFCLLYAEAVKDSAESAWIEMRDIMCDLQRVTNDPQLGCNWWVGEAIIDVIIADACYFPPALASALRVVMVATQRLPQGEDAAKATLSPAKFSSLLNALSISRKKTATSNEVIKHFDVKQNVEEDRIEQLQELLAAQRVKSITDVIPEIRPRLETAMFAFGRATSAKQQQGFDAQVQAFDQSMRTMANIFGIFDQTDLSEVSFHLADAVKGLRGPTDISAEVIETVKTQILFLDSRLINMQRNEAADHLQIQGVTPDVVDRIATETSAELKKVSHIIATHVDSGVGPEKLLAALGSLRELASVYEFAGSHSIAKILAAIVRVISDEVREGVLVETHQLVLAARAMVAVEMYLQYINSKMQPPPSLIDAANKAVSEMGQDTATFRVVTHSDLLAKFEASSADEDVFDALQREIIDVRTSIEDVQKSSTQDAADHLAQFAAASLRLHSAALITDQVKFAELCRASAELAKIMPGRTDDPAFDFRAAKVALSAASEKMLRCMDEYTTKGKVMLFLIDAIRDVTAFLGASGSGADAVQQGLPSVQNTQSRPESIPSVRSVPEGFDQQLIKLFDEDFNEQVLKLREYLEGSDLRIGEHECRIAHNIHGCSLSAACVPISTVFDVLEARFFALKANDDGLSPEQAVRLSQILNGIVAFQSQFPWKTDTPDLPHWLEIAATLTGANSTARDVSGESDTESDEPSPNDPQGPHESRNERLHAESVLTADIDLLDQRASVQTLPVAPAPVFDADYGHEHLDLYLCDADDVIPELQSNIQSWMSDMDNRDVTADIRRNMHTLKGAASIINAAGIRTLTHHMESLFDAMASGAIKPDEHCATLTTFVLNELITMSDAVRNRQSYRTLPALNDFVSDACDMSRVDGDALKEVIRSSYGAASMERPHPEAFPDDQTNSSNASTEAPVEDVLLPGNHHDAEAVPTSSPGADDSIENSFGAEGLDPSATSQAAFAAPLPAVLVPEVIDLTDSTESNNLEDRAGGGTRRGYRGKRGRAVGERQRNFDAKQARKEGQTDNVLPDEDLSPPEPEVTEIVTPNREISRQVQGLIQRAQDSERESSQSKRRSVRGNEKIKVELQLLDNSVKLSNELRASSYRQNTLNRELQLAVVACREKLSLMMTQANKTTVQLRHFNNITNTGTVSSAADASADDQRVYMERFNHISHSHTQLIAQIEQLLQDCTEIITQTTLIDSAYSYQAEVVSSLQRDLIHSRLVMFENEKPNLNGALVGALQISQKKAELQVLGTDTRIDRQLLESIRDPLRHIVTNAVAHGIEHESVRLKNGKPAAGKVLVKASRRAKSLIIEVSDDGAGIDPKAIREKAIAKGLIKADDQLTDQEALHLITEPGFSTASTVSELSGRGVGMDIVRNKIGALGGHLQISSEVGHGTAISLELPITVGSNRALVCRISEQWFAIPTFNMVQVLEYPTTELLAIKAKPGQASIMFEDRSFDVVHLADLMAVPDLRLHSAQAPSHTSLVLVEQGPIRLALEVENGVSMPEIHVTKFEGILSSVKGIIGSTEVHDGTPALVLDVIELARLNLKMTETGYKAKLFRIRRIKREAKPLVLIVDDASSYQKLLTKHFQNLGWDVAVAHNGQDALDKLPTLSAPTLFVVDVEMPRMDGLKLTSRLRALQQFDNTPIIMLTTRANLREKALELGVSEFLPKPYDQATLNEAVRALCPSKDVAGAV